MTGGPIASTIAPLSFRRTVPAVVGDVRRLLGRLVAYEILFRVFSAAVLGPLSAWILAAFISSSGEMVVSNERIASFLLSPAGLIGIAAWGAVGLAGFFAEQAGLILLSADGIRGRKPSATLAFWKALKSLPAMLDLAARQVAIYALVAAPAAGLMAATYFTLLSEHDVNYYLAQRPPAFWAALAIGGVAAGAAALVGAILYLRWILAVPLCLLEGRKPAAAMRTSREATKGRLPAIATLVFGWTLAVSLLAGSGVLAIGLAGDLILAMLGERLALVIPVVASLLTVLAAFAAVAWFLGFAGNSLLVGRIYFAVRGAELPTAAPFERTPAEREAPSGWMPSARALWTAAAVLALAAVLTCYAVIEQLDLRDNVAVTAHRGSSRRAPENSLSAIRQAIAEGADFAEIDVQQTADGQVVLLHDTDLMRVAGVDRKIWEISYPELAELDAGSWFAPEFKDERIPTLAQAIREAGDRIKLNIELKFNGHDDQLVRQVVEVVRAHGFESRCVITSLTLDGVIEAKRLDERLPVGHIFFRALGDVTRLDVDFLSLNADQVDDPLVASAHDAGKQIHVWTVNDPRRMSPMIDLGVDNIITDEPAMLVDVLAERAELSDVERLLLKFRNQVWR